MRAVGFGCVCVGRVLSALSIDGDCFGALVSKCSATLASVAAPPLGARQGFEGPSHARHSSQVTVLPPAKSQDKRHRGLGMGYNKAFWGGEGL